MVAIIGGEPHRFRPLVDLYREAGKRAGFKPEHLKVGVHVLGYVADTDTEAAAHFFPGYAAAFTKIGRERGWPPVTRGQFEALRRPGGALMVGTADYVAQKVLTMSDDLGGLAHVGFQMSVAALPHARQMRSIELLGEKVAPTVRQIVGSAN